MTSIKVCLRGAGIDEYETDSTGTALTPAIEDGCLKIYDGTVVTAYPLTSVLWWEVDSSVEEV